MKYVYSSYKFVVKESGAGKPYITIEPMNEPGNGNLILNVADGGSIKKTQEIANLLNQHVVTLGFPYQSQ